MDPLLGSARPAGTATVGRYARTVVLYPFSFFDLVTWKWYRGGWRDIYL